MVYKPSKYITIHELILNGLPYHQISELLNVAKGTVSGVMKRLKTTGTILPSRNRRSIYDPYIQELTNQIHYYLNKKRNCCYLKDGKSLTRDEIFQLILADGFEVSRTKFNDLHAIENRKLKETFFETHYDPGMIVEFDWGTHVLHINGINKRVDYAVYTFPYSGMIFAYVTEKSDSKNFAHTFNQFIKQVGGIPRTLVVDNMRIARKVQSPTAKPEMTRLFEEISKHFEMDVFFCAPYQPNQKGSVENGVKFIKRSIEESYINEFKSINEVQAFVNQIVKSANAKSHHYKNDTRQRLFKHEKKFLNPLPDKKYYYYEQTYRKVTRDNTITFQRSKYSIPEGYQGLKLKIRFNDHALYVLNSNGDILVKHWLSNKKNSRRQRVWHMLHKIRMKPNGFKDSKEYRLLPKWVKHLHSRVFNGLTKVFINFLFKLKGKHKNVINRCLKRNQITWNELTPELLIEEVDRL